MSHQCVHCGKLYADGSQELLSGCVCGSKFFFYITKEKQEQLKSQTSEIIEFEGEDKKQVEKDVRNIIGINEDEPVILDLESIKVISPGKFQIDIVNLLNRNRPIIYKLQEGKYIIDLSNLETKTKEDKQK